MAAKGRGVKTGCNVGVDTTDPALPVAGTGKLSEVRKSRNARRRAGVLIALHLVIAAHATHFLIAGRTLSPVEPSEAMYTLELGEVNAGFIFLLAALLATLVFGRFVCGWGCHIVAVQDLCGFIMKKLGIRPRPFRSRLLLWVPLGLAFYMFVLPTLLRWAGIGPIRSFPGFSNHLMTTGFWDTFPGPVFAVLTILTCGFAAVYLLGAKGFCSYGCPYGGLFVLMDRLSPGSIVVDDSCEQCGHCTATCTSNVVVHEEVRLYGQVVDPGCMKCMDCVSVCPKGALRYSFSKPSVLKGHPAGKPGPPRYRLGFSTELVLLGICIAATLAFRGLYDGPPLLMSVALGGITAFLSLELWYLIRKPTVRIQNLKLKVAGKLSGTGWIFATVTVLWLAFGGHSAFAQWHRAWGRYHLNRTEAARTEVLSGESLRLQYSEKHRHAATKAYEHFSTADRWGLVPVSEIKLGLAWCHLLRDDLASAQSEIRAAIDAAPGGNVVGLLTAEEHHLFAGRLVESGEPELAVEHFAAAVELQPEAFESRYNFGGLLRRLGRHQEAVEQLLAAQSLSPADADTHIELGLAYTALDRKDEAIEALRLAIELDPSSPESRFHLPGLIQQLEQ